MSRRQPCHASSSPSTSTTSRTSIAFYPRLFGTEPAKVRPGYANFAVAEPALKLVLIENPGKGGSLNHLGVEVVDTDKVDTEQTRLAEAGLASVDERDTTCCYAKQDKFWVEGAPDREQLGDLHGPRGQRGVRRPRRGERDDGAAYGFGFGVLRLAD